MGRQPPPSPAKSHRNGFTMLELLMALIVLGALMSIVAPTLAAVQRQRLEVVRHQIALAALNNLAEQVSVQPWEALTADWANGLRPSDEIQSQLPDAHWNARWEEVTEPAPARVVHLQVDWQVNSVRRSVPVRLTVWRVQSEAL